jgi:hypothetical protein
MEEGSASDNNYDDNYDKNNYYKFLNSIIHKNEFKSEYDSAEENEQYIYFNQPSEYEYDNNIPELIIDEVLKKDKPKSNFYKYFFGSILFVSSAITVSYFFSKKRNKNKN